MTTTSLRTQVRRDDSGAVLVLALLVLLVFSLVLGALFTNSSTGQKNTPVVRKHLSKVYAADAGIDAGISRLRKESQYCATAANPTADTSLPTLADGRDVTVRCEVLSSTSNLGAAGYAAIVTSTASDAFTTTNGSTKSVTGPMFMAGTLANSQVLNLHKGDLDHLCASAGGTTIAPSSSVVTFDNGFGYSPDCKAALPIVPHVLPQAPASSGSCILCTPLPSVSDAATCVIFSPGRYTAPPNLDSSHVNYFASGTYFFDNIGAWAIKQAIVVGGLPTAPETASCATTLNDTQGGGTGAGATFVFGGSSFIDFDVDAHLEIFERVLPATDTTSTPGLAVVALTNLEPNQGYSASTVTGDLFKPKNGNTPDFILHGVLYAPSSTLTVNATNGVRAQLLEGLIVNKFRIEEASSSSALQITITFRPGSRRVRLTSTASAATFNGIADGGKDTTSVAVLDIPTQAGFPVTVKAWRSTAPDFS